MGKQSIFHQVDIPVIAATDKLRLDMTNNGRIAVSVWEIRGAKSVRKNEISLSYAGRWKTLTSNILPRNFLAGVDEAETAGILLVCGYSVDLDAIAGFISWVRQWVQNTGR